MVTYGDSGDPFIDQLTISAEADGAVVLSDQIILAKSGQMDNSFNMNDTIYITLQEQSFVITSGNTWTK